MTKPYKSNKCGLSMNAIRWTFSTLAFGCSANHYSSPISKTGRLLLSWEWETSGYLGWVSHCIQMCLKATLSQQKWINLHSIQQLLPYSLQQVNSVNRSAVCYNKGLNLYDIGYNTFLVLVISRCMKYLQNSSLLNYGVFFSSSQFPLWGLFPKIV